jgi:hypothetical protein
MNITNVGPGRPSRQELAGGIDADGRSRPTAATEALKFSRAPPALLKVAKHGFVYAFFSVIRFGLTSTLTIANVRSWITDAVCTVVHDKRDVHMPRLC